jgi:hypothetical protein
MPRPSKTKAREDFAQAFAGILSQLDLRPIAQALADWRQAVEALKEEVQTVHDEASAYVDERSDTWIRGRSSLFGLLSLRSWPTLIL